MVRQPVGAAYVDRGATALDPMDGDITRLITVSGLDTLTTNAAADFLIRYNVRDSRGLDASEVTRVVRVAGSGFARQTKRHFGETSAPMGYWEHLPTSYSDDPAARFPLIVFNHGIGEAPDFPQVDLDAWAASPDALDRLLRRGLSGIIDHGRWDDSRAFVVLSPQRCVNGLDKEDAFVSYALDRYNVDPSRVYMVGFSMGAGNTWGYLLGHPDRLAAAVTISGGGDQSSRAGCVMKDTPTWSFHAADDQTVPVGDTLGTVASIMACQPAVPTK